MGKTFTMITPASLAATTDSKYPVVSAKGDYLVFRSKMVWPTGALVSSKEEAWMAYTANTADVKLTKISNLAGMECDTTALFSSLVTKHGQQALDDAGIT